MLDTNSSLGSSTSPFIVNLPPIRVYVEDQKMGLEEQSAQISVVTFATTTVALAVSIPKQEEGFVVIQSSPPPFLLLLFLILGFSLLRRAIARTIYIQTYLSRMTKDPMREHLLGSGNDHNLCNNSMEVDDDESMELQDDGVWQGFVSSLVSDDSNQVSDTLSPEDAAWVDSCLVKDAELSESGWDALKDVLLDIINVEASSSDNISSGKVDGFPRRVHDYDDVPTVEETGNTQSLGGVDNNHVLGGTMENMNPLTEEAENKMLQVYLRNKLSKPRDKKKDENADVGSGWRFPSEIDQPVDNIFKVWDLETLEIEEDELAQQLEKAIAASSVDASPPALDNPVKDPNMESFNGIVAGMADLSLQLDDLVTGMADLSLHQIAGS